MLIKNGKKVQPIVKDIDDMSKTTNVDFLITFHGNHLQILESNTCDNGCNELEKVLKLYTSVPLQTCICLMLMIN